VRFGINDYLIITGVILILVSGVLHFSDLQIYEEGLSITPTASSIGIGETESFIAVLVAEVSTPELHYTWFVDEDLVAVHLVYNEFSDEYTTTPSLPVGTYIISCAVLGDYGAIYYTDEATLMVTSSSTPTPTPSASPAPTPSASPTQTTSPSPTPTPTTSPTATPSFSFPPFDPGEDVKESGSLLAGGFGVALILVGAYRKRRKR